MNNDTGPREKRSSVIIRALILLPNWNIVERRVRNLSDTGACIDNDGDIAVGDQLRLDMGALSNLDATVMWTIDRLAGIKFDELVDLEAARKPRGIAVAVTAGWLAELKDAYKSN